MRIASLIAVSVAVLALACEEDKPAPEAEPEAADPVETVVPAKTTAPRPSASAPPAPAELPAPPDVAEAPKDAARTKSGLASKVLVKGTGKAKPKPTDSVRVNYAGWTKDGKMFDASKGQPVGFGVSDVIPGWTEGLQLMVAGEKRRLWIPGKLAYGDQPRMMGAPAGDLVFDVELVEIVKPPETPKDLKQPPADATKTASGLVYKILEKGKGGEHPTASNRVTVHYSGWSKDGKMFDSSVTRGSPSTFPLGGVIKGWTEGLQLMSVGDKARLWIPAALAYGEKPARPGAPAGDLVFDVELLAIQ